MNNFNTPSQKFLVEFNKICLKEGLIASWDVELLFEQLKKIFKDKLEHANLTPLSDYFSKIKKEIEGKQIVSKVCTLFIKLKKPLSEQEEKDVKTQLNKFGYFNSLWWAEDKTLLQIEPNVPIQMNSFIEMQNSSTNTFYHVTKNSVLKKIEKIGLTPKDSQTTHDHPSDRIYLLWIPDVLNTFKVLKSWINVIADDKKLKQEDLVVIETSYNSSKKYFLDDTTTLLPSMKVIGLFTTSNISPNDLKVFELSN